MIFRDLNEDIKKKILKHYERVYYEFELNTRKPFDEREMSERLNNDGLTEYDANGNLIFIGGLGVLEPPFRTK